MKTIKRTLALVIVFCLMISFVPVASAADEAIAVAASNLTGLTVGTPISDASFVYTLTNGVFVDTLVETEFSPANLPFGLTVKSVTRNSNTQVTVVVEGTPTTANTTPVGTITYLPISTSNITDLASSITPTGTATASAVTLGTGAAVTVTTPYPVASATVTSSTIVASGGNITNSSTATLQLVEYACITSGSDATAAAGATNWSTTPSFTGLAANTDYFIWARTAAITDKYAAGSPTVCSAAIKTAMNSGASVSGTITATARTSTTLTVSGAVSSNTTNQPNVEYAYSTASNVTDASTLTWTSAASGSGTVTFSSLVAGTTYYVYARAAENGAYAAGAMSAAYEFKTLSVLTNASFTISNTPLTYSGTATAANIVAATGVTYDVTNLSSIMYNGNGTIPTAVGSYTVTFNAAANGEYEAKTGLTLTFVISARTPTASMFTLTNTSQTYTGSDLAPTYATTYTGTGTIAYTIGTTTAATATKQTTAGTYNVYASITGDSNYSTDKVLIGTFTISKATGGTVTVPAVPTTYASTTATAKAVTLTGNTEQSVEYALSTSNSTAPTSSSAWQTSLSFTGLTSSTKYYVWARAKESTNYLAGTARVSSTYFTTSGDTNFTNVPRNVSATSASTTSIKVSWTASSPAATTYRVYYSTSSSFTNSTTSSTTTSSTSTTITGLDKNTKYYFYVVAIKSGYNDATSSTVNATTGGTSNTTEYFVVNTSESSSKATSSIDAYEFSDAAVGYAQPDPETFWIHNVYGSTIKGITVKLTGDNKSSFTLSTSKIESQLDKSEETYFTLVPNEGLKKGTYECTITISASTSAVEDYVIDVTFEVGTASLYFSTKKSGTAISSLEFDNAVEGYSISGTQTVYVNNDSGSQLKGVEVAISGTDKSSFKLTGGSLGTIKDGDYASFEIAPVAGLTAGTYTAKLTVSNTTNTKTATMTLSFKVTAGTGTVDTTPTPTASFVDTTSHWAKDYIESLYAQGYVSGIGSNQFAPNNTLTRAQFVQFLYNGFGSGAIASACPFADVDQTAWYKNAVNWAYANGLVTGYSSTEFGPNYPITREQMATIMGRLSEQYGVSLPSTNARAAFADDSDIASYAKDYVYKMQMADIISGKSGNVFDPKGNTTRGEMSKVMYYVLYYAGKIGTAYRVA